MLLNGKYILKFIKDEKEYSLNATVPGCVHTDLLNENMIEDIFYRDNSKKVQWIENLDFTYTKEFEVTEVEDKSYLLFEGIDTYSKVYLNDVLLGETDNMFIPNKFYVDGLLVKGKNVLKVEIFSPIKAVKDCPRRGGAFTTERMNTRRIQCTYGWDWVERYVTMGIFKNVKLLCEKDNEIDSVYAYTKNINPFTAQIGLSVSIDNFNINGDEIKIKLLSPNGDTVFEKTRKIIFEKINETIDVVNPMLWYPNGYGAQPLYRFVIETANDKKEFNFGIRKIDVIQIVDKEGTEEREKSLKIQSNFPISEYDFNKQTSSFTLLCNGVKIFCKGANWVPCEPFPSNESDEKIENILKLSKQGNVNMIRVWGGGVFEKELFYDTCDKLGILVTQDFLMACGDYPEKEEWFKEHIKKEALYASKYLRNHACLAWWAGDNENACRGNENITEYPGFISANELIGPILQKEDPYRLFLPSSPYGGDMFCSATVGTTHATYYLCDLFSSYFKKDEFDYYEFFNRLLSRFNVEQPIFGMSFESSLEKYLSKEDMVDESEEMFKFHTKSNPAFGDLSVYDFTSKLAKLIFGEYSSLKDRTIKLQMLACEWIRVSMELYRRNKWYSSGMLYWMLNDCWPAASGWSIIDYYTCPKPSFYAFKRATKKIISSIHKDDEYKVFICNDSLKDENVKGRFYVYGYINDKENYSFDFEVKAVANETVKIKLDTKKIEEAIDENTVLLCDIESESEKDRSIYFYKNPCKHNFEYSYLKILEETDEYFKVTADSFQPFGMIDVNYLLDDNAIIIKKNEIVTLKKVEELK